MMDSTETPEQLEKLLADGRAALQEFEDGVDHGRLMLRLRTASPAHPVLLARFLFAALGMLCTVSAVVVLVIGTLDNDLSRKVQTFERALQAPEGVPAVPAVLLGFALWWGLCWAFATLAARGLGRDAQMLPWEQQQHQKLVNEVTRLTTQKAVMERIRSTPAGARPRIATPVPGIRSATASSALGSGGFNRTPAGAGPYSGGGGGGFGYNTPDAGPRSAGAGGFGAVGGGFSASSDSGYSPSGNAGFGNSGQGQGFLASEGSSGGGFGSGPASGGQGFGASSGGQGFSNQPSGGYQAAGSGAGPAASNEGSGGFGSGASSSGSGYSASSGGFGRPASFEGPQGGGFGNTPNAALRASGFGGGYAAPSDRAPGSTTPAGYTPPAGGFGAPSGGFDSASQEQDDEDDSEEGDIPMGGGGGVRLGVKRTAPAAPAIDVSDIVERGVLTDAPPEPEPPPAGGFAAGGILSKARGGATGSRATPYGSAGRVRVPNGPGRQPGPLGRSTRGGTPLGAAPRATSPSRARLAAPLSFPGTPKGSESRDAAPTKGMFGTPPPLSRSTGPAAPSTPPIMSYSGPPLDEVMVMEEEESEEDLPTVSAARPMAAPTPQAGTPPGGPADLQRRVPTWGTIEDPWLREALAKAEALVGSYPAQAYLEFSQEPHLPFTLVIARATPAMAVRAMVNFVEFLASIYTPPRARIELVNVAHLDRSFDQNVQAALEPYFGANVEVEADPGRVDILFTDPDPGWGAYPTLPTQ